jgi:dipeptidyl aminopeptidase/acylaminoacyl peptidase
LTFRPGDLRREIVLGSPELSRPAGLVAYTRRRIEGGEYRTDVWTVPFAGGRSRQLTRGECNDSHPRFSPDGRFLAYLCDAEDETKQVHLLDLTGGEPTVLTSFGHGVTELEWLPDGRGIAVLAHDDRSPIRVGDRRKGEPTARVVRRIDWRLDGEGLLERPTHVAVVGLDGKSTRLTSGDWRASCLRVEPGGERIAFIADPRDERDVEPHSQVFAFPAGGGEVEALTRSPGPVTRFSFDADGTVVCVAYERVLPRDDEAPQVFRVQDGELKPLTAELDRHPDGDTRNERLNGIADRGRVVPYRLGDDQADALVDMRRDPVVHALAGERGQIVSLMTLGAAVVHPDLYAIDAEDSLRGLTSDAREWLEPFGDVVFGEMQVQGPAGAIQVFVYSPPGAPDEPLPTVVIFHGGPTWAWNLAPDLNTLLFAHAGYRVVRPNIRGSFDRGRRWMAGLVGRWGEADAEDVHAVIDGMVDEGLSDPQRLGCYGNSYGGFLVNWLVGTTDRFAAAVSQNGVTNQVAAFGNCDLGAPYGVAAELGDVTTPEGVEKLWRSSPLRNVASIRTPLLILQGESDLRCPPSDNEQLFVALRWLRREVEYVLYPESSHDMTQSARIDRRIDRAERMLGWFHRYMPP